MLLVSIGVACPLAQAQVEFFDLAGDLTLETRHSPESGLYPGQTSSASGFSLTPRLYFENAQGWSFNLTPFLRIDHVDSERTHMDLRQAYFLMFGDIGDDQWELRLGIDQVFWGVTESQHLVDIINQVDLVENPSAEQKLGQTMVHFTRFGNWGTAELFVLPFHRPRTFPGAGGRLRLALPVDPDPISRAASNDERHIDLAARYSHSFGPLDLGLSVFDGTSREPVLFPELDAIGSPALLQHYDDIRQYGLDAQLTTGAWLLKLEAIHRSGETNLVGEQEDYAAAVMGFEYQFQSVFGGTDLSLVSEWNIDARGDRALPRRNPLTLQNDLAVLTRFGFNDVSGSELTIGVIRDMERDSQLAAVEFSRRLTDRWSISLEWYGLLEIDPDEIFYQARRDSFFELSLSLFL
ncbi:MAG: hypothetical protein OXD01_10045 [Gammaproteobacteria bacterium]|nr:hypothetical protein [Gammaproteobacteria bacterium]